MCKVCTYNGDGVVDVAEREEIGTHALLLDLPGQHLPHTVRVVEQVPHLDSIRIRMAP